MFPNKKDVIYNSVLVAWNIACKFCGGVHNHEKGEFGGKFIENRSGWGDIVWDIVKSKGGSGSSNFCAKKDIFLGEKSLKCPDSEKYCKFRSSCCINFLENERRQETEQTLGK